MYILIYDKMQDSDISNSITTPALSDIYEGALPVAVDFGSSQKVDCVGIGYTDATEVYISDGTNTRTINYTEKGLYLIEELNSQNITIDHNGTYIGRVALGEKIRIGLSPQREPGFYTTNQSRITASGQVIGGAGGYSGKQFGFDVRYKLDSVFFDNFKLAYPGQLSKNYPVFCDLEREDLYPFRYFYGRFNDTDFVFQGSAYKYLYSRTFTLLEAF